VDKISQEANSLAYKIPYKLLREIIYQLGAGSATERANLASDLEKLVSDAIISDAK